MKPTFFKVLILIFLVQAFQLNAQIPKEYKGKPFRDKYYKKGAQQIPGRVELAYYDLGGEGVAYHDVTPENEGSKLNHEVHDYGSHWRPGVPEYIAFFRENEGVDISYTKDWADFNHPNKVDPMVNQLYIGWESDGEWTNYTVQVNKAGKYRIITVYGNQDNHSELWLNGSKACSLLLPENTGNWHYWTQATIGEIVFPKAGKNLLTLKYNKGSNLAYLDFLLVESAKE
ncbi:MAG: carbohydrate-binding protein [Bacteroidota bacterium]